MATGFRTLVLLVAMVGAATAVCAGPDSNVEVCILDAPSGSYRPVLAAKLLASQIYADAGITLRWANHCTTGMLVVTMLTRDGEATMIARLRARDTVMGFALAGARHVYLFYDRLSRNVGPRFEQILARVIAHEIGHVLLPAQGHTDRGLMRSQADPKEPATFTATQREFMHQYITAALIPSAVR